MNRIALLTLFAACADAPSLDLAPAHSHNAQAVWSNGDFESDSIGAMPPSGWTLTNYTNNKFIGTSSAPPTAFSSLNLTTPGTRFDASPAVGGTNYGEVDPDLGNAQAFRFPIYGQRAARVNYKDTSVTGKDKNVNVLQQTQTIALGDIDPVDQQIHVRFAIAPVLEVPAHNYNEQPYYYVQLQNLTRNTQLYGAFNVAGQAGVPWKTTKSVRTGNTTQWLDWQLVDIAPGNAAIAIGDQVQLTIVAAGCSLGGHFGRIYVDGISAVIPGIFASATAPSTVNAGATLTYTINYNNGGTATTVGTRVDMVTPPNTTFASTTGTNCTTPSTGATGTISCPLGSLAPGAFGSFTVTVTVSSSATGSIVNGNYAISAINAPTLLGSKVTTKVSTSSTVNADVVVTQTASTATTDWGQAFTSAAPLYTIKIRNNSTTTQLKGTTSNLFTDTFPSQLTGVSWSCSVTNAGSAASGTATKCKDSGGNGNTSITGTGNISVKPRLGYNGGEITYKVWGTIASGSGLATLTNTSAMGLPGGGVNDPNTTNNTSTSTVQIGVPVALTLTKNGATYGTVSSSPVGLSCTAAASCGNASAQFASGTQVILTAAPVAGAVFSGWSGACSGTANTCSLTMSSTRDVTATFAAAPAAGPASNIYLYRGNNQLARTGTAFSIPLTVLVTDSAGMPKADTSVTFSAPSGATTATLGSTSATTNAAGVASVSATASATAGEYQVTASISGASVAFSLVNVGAPASIEYLSGGDAEDPQIAPVSASFTSPLVAVVRDSAGNTVSGATVAFTVAPSGGASATLAAATGSTDEDGLTHMTATAGTVVGDYTVSASIGSGTDAVFSLQNVSTGPAAIYILGGNNQSAATSAAFASPLSVVVADSAGNSLPNVNVAFAASGATLVLSSPSGLTDSIGQTSVSATAGPTGGVAYVVASVTGVSPSAQFSLTLDGGQTIAVSAGDGQSATVGTRFATQLQALVTDANDNPVNNVTVTFTPPSSGALATLSSLTAQTNTSGIAAVTGTAGTVAGGYSVSASTANALTPVGFALTNVAGNASKVVAVSGSGQSAAIDSAFASNLVARVTDTYDNPLSGVSVAFTTVASSGATADLSSAATSDSSGLTHVTATARGSAGSFTVLAAASGATSASFTLTNTCAADAHCPSGNYCAAGSCVPKRANDQVCSAANQCTSGACHTDGNCGYPNGAGTCTSGDVCRTGVCGSDDICGYKDEEGSCTAGTASLCRSGVCSASLACQPLGGCLVHADCPTTSFCHALSCTPDLANSVAMPVACTGSNGGAVCQSGVCDSDDKCGYKNGTGTCASGDVCRSQVCGDDGACGYPNGEGLCTDGDAATICRGGDCSDVAFVCKPVTGCAVDGDCGNGQWCDNFACVSKRSNGSNCTAANMCASGICHSDGKCGYPDGEGSCTLAAAGPCRSGVCSSTLVCRAADACFADADCQTTQYCDTSLHACAAKRANGGACNQTVMCQSGICDNGSCGHDNGDGPCSAGPSGDAGIVCRSSTCSPNALVCIPAGGCSVDQDCPSGQWCDGFTCAPHAPNGDPCQGTNECTSSICDSDGHCGYPAGTGDCTADATVCRSGTCSTIGVCREADGCLAHGDCDTSTHFCDLTAHECTPKLANDVLLPNGVCADATIFCASGVCDIQDNRCGHALTRGVCSLSTQCRQGVCDIGGTCVECVTHYDCAGASPICDTATNTCVQCTADEQCGGGTPRCDQVSKHCVAAPAPVEPEPEPQPEPELVAAPQPEPMPVAPPVNTVVPPDTSGEQAPAPRLYPGGNGFGRGCQSTPVAAWLPLLLLVLIAKRRRAITA